LKHEWTDGVQISELKELDTLCVETRHHEYEITIIDPSTASSWPGGLEDKPR
jgi:hypothetical protein